MQVYKLERAFQELAAAAEAAQSEQPATLQEGIRQYFGTQGPADAARPDPEDDSQDKAAAISSAARPGNKIAALACLPFDAEVGPMTHIQVRIADAVYGERADCPTLCTSINCHATSFSSSHILHRCCSTEDVCKPLQSCHAARRVLSHSCCALTPHTACLQVKAAAEEVRARAPAGARVTARAVARVLHGRDTPTWRRQDWAKCPGWGKCLHVPFEQLRRLAQEALLAAL